MLDRHIICVVGARPNFMKMAPILRALSINLSSIPVLLVHTGQHYDKDMSDKLFDDLKLPRPDINLEVGSATHAIQTADVMQRFEPILDAHNPYCVIVVGDVNSTLACALVAAKKGILVAHVEAGLRSYDKKMPEEVNRILTDQIADRLYTTERSAENNLIKEGISSDRICFVGNVMIDSLLYGRKSAPTLSKILQSFDINLLESTNLERYAVVTLHRPSNVDKLDKLGSLLDILAEISKKIPLIFTLHPRTKNNIIKFNLNSIFKNKNIIFLPPQGYLEMLGLLSNSTLILTDSGGLQEESTALGIPCLTLRENTERPITVDEGTNTIVGGDRDLILSCVDQILLGKGKSGKIPEYWDGSAAERITEDLKKWLCI
ncbi:UDP-N-acetylglucosamine 2-epimerase (non-hydrolyzing) [Rhodoferax sp.]|uniref:non-hydrolyzing UDP-N-acetylglucosamine 2-epimerase n=1 Tax=Rhodoferax sp. TaxID=50421 RepID=UPI0025F1395B|nr:UDP-N-acetylglucosamine 2-epimerase (non-hydrolyzing) [Rhodoferax sp.]